MSELILYQTEDGKAQVRLRAEEGSVWLSQSELAEDSVIKESLITASNGKSSCQGILDSCRSRQLLRRGKES